MNEKPQILEIVVCAGVMINAQIIGHLEVILATEVWVDKACTTNKGSLNKNNLQNLYL